jgi:DNA replication protein DnaC
MKENIAFYAKLLKIPSFKRYEDLIRQLSPDLSYEQFLYEIMKQELEQRQESSRRRRIRKAGFPITKTLDEFDYSRLEHVASGYIQELAAGDYIAKRQNIIMVGNPGSGKTHLSIGLGIKACSQGLNVRFYTAMKLATQLAEAIQEHRLSRLERALNQLDLLIIDELSYLTFNRYQSEMLFQVVTERTERGSIILSTNLEFSKWT